MNKIIYAILIIMGTVTQASEPSVVDEVYVVGSIEGYEYEEVEDAFLEDVAMRGMVISYVSHAHAMLLRTAGDINPGYNTYDEAKIFLFCSAEQAHMMVSESPHVLTMCPYAMAIYKLKDNEKIFISYKKSDVPIYAPAINLLEDIQNSVLGELD